MASPRPPPAVRGPLSEAEEPLLDRHDAEAAEGVVGWQEVAGSADNYWACVFNLTKAIFGAGMMALPHACTLLGAYLGFGLVALVGVMTWASINWGVVQPATVLMRRKEARQPAATLNGGYSGVVRTYLGTPASQLLNAFLLANSIGFSVMYVDVIADVLLGDEASPGAAAELITWLLPEGSPLAALLLRRPVFVALLMVSVVLPISLRRDMAALGPLNVLGLTALAALFASAAWLAAAAAASGTAHALPLWPDVDALGRMAGGGSALLAALSLLPVMLTADGCHINMMPLARMIRPYSAQQLSSVAGMSLGIASGFYIAFSAAAYFVFGDALQEDFLSNLTPAAMRPLVGRHSAILVGYGVRVAYAVSLLGNTAINNFPLRDALLDTVITDPAAKAAALDSYFMPITLGVLLLVYVLAVSMASVWSVIGFVGGITSTGVCYLFPAALMYMHSRTFKAADTMRRTLQGGAAALFAIGLGITVNTVLRPL